MTRDELIKQLNALEGRVSNRVLNAARNIVRLAYSYNYMGKNFTFDADDDLDRQVNNLLIELSDYVVSESVKTPQNDADEEDRDNLLLFLSEEKYGQTYTERADNHASHLKFLIEAYIATRFVSKTNLGQMIAGLKTYLANPFNDELIKKAKGTDYASDILSETFTGFGKGSISNPREALGTLAADILSTGEQWNVLNRFKKDPNIIGYTIHRGSDFDCPICDSYCIGVHPLSEQILPIHPRCMCYAKPVYK